VACHFQSALRHAQAQGPAVLMTVFRCCMQSDLQGLGSSAVQLAQLYATVTSAHESLQSQVGHQARQCRPTFRSNIHGMCVLSYIMSKLLPTAWHHLLFHRVAAYLCKALLMQPGCAG
jgi:hypothetical protein